MKILNYIKNNFKFILGILLVLLIIFNIDTCRRLNNEKNKREQDKLRYENNLSAQKDSLKMIYDSIKNVYISEKLSYVINDIEELKKYNNNLYNDFKDVKNSVAGIKSSVNILINGLTSINNPVNINDTTYRIPFNFNYKDDGLNQFIKGRTEFVLSNNNIYNSVSYLDTSLINIKLKYAFKDEGNKYKVWATSPSPYVKIYDIDGYIYLDKYTKNDKKKKLRKITFGPNFNFGFNSDLKGQNMRFGWSLGFGISYNLF